MPASFSMNDAEQKVFDALARPADGSVFELFKVQTITVPHPYCIASGHVAEASDHYSGMLTKEAIRSAEKKGVYCDICRQRNRSHGDPILDLDQHETMLTAFIAVPGEFSRSGKLNDVPGLHAYLLSIKAQAESLGVQSFAFPPK